MKIFSVLTCTVLLGGLLACQTYVEVETDLHAPTLVVYSILQPDSLVAVWVSQTQSVSQNQSPTAVNRAKVTITPEGQAPQTLPLVSAEWGKYQTNFRPQPGVTYQLSVTAEGFPPVTATTRLPRPVAIQELRYAEQSSPNPKTCYDCPDSLVDYAMRLTFADPPSEENYYELAGWIKEPKEYYIYNSSSSVPLDTIRYNVFTPLAIWSTDPTVNTAEDAVLYDEAAQRYLLNIPFDDEIFDGESYTFRFQTVEGEASSLIKIALRTYHEEAYRYERAKEVQRSYHNEDLFYEPVPIPSNVQGGYGIFGSFSQDTVTLEMKE